MLISTKTIAARRDCDPATVRRLAAKLKIGTKIGRDWLFTAEQAEALEKKIQKQGNPNFVPGNYLGQPPKKSRKKTA